MRKNMKGQSRLFATVLLLMLAAATAAQAQWPSDPAENLAIADRPDEQAVPHIVATSDGGAYVGWYDHCSGNYDVYLTKLDPLGFEEWGDNGLLISDHKQDTWVMDWHLIADSGDNAVLTFADIRDGKGYSLNAYRVDPDGTMLWGEDGILLATSKRNELIAGARVAEASDGDFVVIWTQWTTGRTGKLQMQRISPEGVVRFAFGGLTLVREPGAAPAFPDVVAAEDGSVIISWVADNLLESDSKFLLAQKFGADGGKLWPKPVSVFDACSLPVAYMPTLQSDGAGGALLAWHYTPWLIYNAAVQHLDASGQELFPHNGVNVATNPDLYHYYPAMSYDAATGAIYIFFREYDSVHGEYGLYGQLFSPSGERLWGDDGKVFIPLSSIEVSSPVSLPAERGAMAFWMDRHTGSWDDIRVLAMRVDDQGNLLWTGAPVLVSIYPSAKGDLQVAGDPYGNAMLVWDDERNEEITEQDLYGQNVNADGTLGN
jgi:hypothetical protein